MSTFNGDQHSPGPARGAHVHDPRLAAAPPGAPTLRESRDGWLRDGRRRQLSPDTRQSYRESTDEFLAVVGPQRTTDSLAAEDLDRYLVALNSASRARGALSIATQGARIARVRAWLNWAWRAGDLMTALGGQCRPPSVPVTTPPPLPLAQIRSMLGRVSLRNQVLLLILLDTGLRIGDALRLRRTDLCHMQDGQPYFEVAISKTHSGGQAPISAATERVLRVYLHREFPRLWTATWGARPCPAEAFVFFSTRRWGRPTDRRSVEKLCARLKQATGWVGKCSPQIFRHTAGNFAAEMGLNEVRIAQYLGHRTLKMVKRYTGKVNIIREFDAVSPVNALGDIPSAVCQRPRQVVRAKAMKGSLGSRAAVRSDGKVAERARFELATRVTPRTAFPVLRPRPD